MTTTVTTTTCSRATTSRRGRCPPPRADLADAVIARARQGEPAAARAPVAARRRWWPRAAIAVGVAAAVAVAVGRWGLERPPASGHGEVFATRAQRFALGPTTAMLDAGTQVQWRRDARRIRIVQPRGAATWTVAAADTLVIDADAMGASVEASGASLRVEVEMNRSDTRAIAISSAAAVAVVA